MRVYHLNCGTMHFDGSRIVCHTLLIETAIGIVIVDTGFGLGDIERPQRLGTQFLQGLSPTLCREETAIVQLQRLGFRVEDVRHVVMTHLDRDHAGGINDFPHALIHVHRLEHRCAVEGAPGVRPGRYLVEQFADTTRWRFFEERQERWFGLPSLTILAAEPRLIAVHLPGHTPGHCGIAVQKQRGWLFHAADSHYHHLQRRLPPQTSSPALDAFQRSADSETPVREASQRAICRLQADHPEIDIICTHDPFDFDRYAEVALLGEHV